MSINLSSIFKVFVAGLLFGFVVTTIAHGEERHEGISEHHECLICDLIHNYSGASFNPASAFEVPSLSFNKNATILSSFVSLSYVQFVPGRGPPSIL